MTTGLATALALALPLGACRDDAAVPPGGSADTIATEHTTMAGPADPGAPTPPSGPLRSEPLPPPRDPDVAVREEFDAAVAAGTAAAFEMFVARHPGSPLAAEARARIATAQGD